MKLYRVVGILGATVAYLFIAVSIAVNPWFNFYNNALSDLGNTLKLGSTALVFDAGLILSGLLETSFAILVSRLRSSWKNLIWTVPLSVAGADLALVGFFNESWGRIHFLVSVTLFVSMIVTMLLYSYVSWTLGTPVIGALALVFGISSAVVWFVQWPWKGVAIQETLSSAMGSILIVMISLKGSRQDRTELTLKPR